MYPEQIGIGRSGHLDVLLQNIFLQSVVVVDQELFGINVCAIDQIVLLLLRNKEITELLHIATLIDPLIVDKEPEDL